MLAKLNLFIAAIGLVFSFIIYTNSFLNPEIACALGAANCIELAAKSIFRNFSLFLTLGLFLSFITNFIKFFTEKEGYKVTIVANLLSNLITFLIAGVLLITSITSVETKNAVNILAILVWAGVFINVVISLLEMKPAISQLHAQNQGGYNFAFSVLLFLLISSLGSLIFSNSLLNKRNGIKIEELSNISKGGQVSAKVDLSPLLAGLDRLREDIKSGGAGGGTGIDYSKFESSMRNAIVSAFADVIGKKGNAEPQKPKEFPLAQFDIENDYFLGPKDAPVTIVEFAAFTCPFCVMLHPVIKAVLKKYPNKVKYVLKNYPLDFPVMHYGQEGEPVDTKIAEFVEAAGAQGKYWEAADKIMEKFDELRKNNKEEFNKIHGDKNAYTVAQKYLKDIAKELGLDYGKIEESIDKGVFKEKIERHKSTGARVGVEGTPAIYINGKPFMGNWVDRTPQGFVGKPEAFYPVIDEELKAMNK